MEVSRELLEYLNSVQDLYKSGIPLALLEADAAGAQQNLLLSWGSQSAKLCFVGLDRDWRLDPAAQPFSGANGEILRALIENGLKLQVENVRVLASLHVLPGAAPMHYEKLAEKVRSELEQGLVVVLGEQVFQRVFGRQEAFSEIRGKILPHNRLNLLPTYSLSQIRSDLALKREFWSDLQTLVGKI